MAEESSEQNTTTGTMSKRMARQIAVIAASRDMHKWEVLEKYAANIIDREFRKVRDEMSHDIGGEG